MNYCRAVFVTGMILAVPIWGQWIDKNLEHGGEQRKVRLYLPAASKDLSLVVAIHGGGGNLKTLELTADLSKAAERYQAVVVFPQGVAKKMRGGRELGTWNAGRCCGRAHKENVDDVGYLRKVIATTLAEYPRIDRAKVYMFGHSNGSMMTFRYACEASETVAAIAGVGATGVFDSETGKWDNCPLTQRMPTFYVHGTADRCSPYAGGKGGSCFTDFLSSLLPFKIPPDPHSSMKVPAVRAFFSGWAAKNGYVDLAAKETPATAVECEGFGTRSPKKIQAKLCTVTGMGHTWPGGKLGEPCHSKPTSKACREWKKLTQGPADTEHGPYPDFSATDAFFRFFAEHRR